MKKTTKQRSHEMTRRQFVGRALTTAGVIAGAPAFLRGQNLNNKLNIAFIACGGRANTSLGELTIVPGRSGSKGGGKRGGEVDPHAGPHPDENVAVICDVNQTAIDAAAQRYPNAKKFTDLRRVFDTLRPVSEGPAGTLRVSDANNTTLADTYRTIYAQLLPAITGELVPDHLTSDAEVTGSRVILDFGLNNAQ